MIKNYSKLEPQSNNTRKLSSRHLLAKLRTTSQTKLKPVYILTVAVTLGLANLPAHACQIPKSYYSNVFCTSDSNYFLALKDSGQPVALINKQGKRVADLMKYDAVDANKLQQGLMPVRRLGRVGYVNTAGREVIPAVYDPIIGDRQTKGWARAMHNNRIVVKKAGKFGVINSRNKIIVPFSADYVTISNYQGGLAKITTRNSDQWVDIHGLQAASPVEPLSNSTNNTAISANSSTAVKLEANTIKAGGATENTTILAPATPEISSIPSTGFTAVSTVPLQSSAPASTVITNTSTANIVKTTSSTSEKPVSVKHPNARPSSMRGEIWQPHQQDGQWGFIDKNNVLMITYSFNQVTPFTEGLAGVRIGDRWGFINLAGQVVIPFSYEESKIQRGNNDTYKGSQPFQFTNGKAWVSNTPNGIKICINQEGKYVPCD